MEWDLFVAVVSIAFLVYFRGAYLFAQKQKLVATKLYSYSRFWQSFLVDNSDFFDLFYLGIEWSNEIQELIKKGGQAEDMLEIKNRKRKKLSDIEEAIREGNGINERELMEKMARYGSHFEVTTFLDISAQAKQNILDGKTFITDEEVSYLGDYYASVVIGIKMNIMIAFDKIVGVIARYLNDPEQFSVRKEADEISQVLWYTILAAKDFDLLNRHLDHTRKKNILTLTIENMFLKNR